MIDRRAVMKALELESRYPNGWDCRDECPYYGRTDCDCYTQVARDALELLKGGMKRMKITFMLNGFCTVRGAEHGEDPVRIATEIENLLERELGVDEASVVITAYEEDDE